MEITDEEGSTVRSARARTAAAGLAVALLAACSSVTGGRGTAVSTSASSSHPRFPSTSATTPAPTSPTLPATTPAPTSSRPDTAAARAVQLQAQTNGEANVLVRVPGGYQAASWDQNGRIGFWSEAIADTTWRLIGHSGYPDVAALGPPQATARGALLRNMRNATFIVHGNFTGDGSGNAVAFTTGPYGWGAIKAQPDGNIAPSGHPVGADLIGLGYDFAFRDGYLETKDCSTDRPISDCDEHPVTKLWVWAGDHFVRA
jgi:hypothetical protein